LKINQESIVEFCMHSYNAAVLVCWSKYLHRKLAAGM